MINDPKRDSLFNTHMERMKIAFPPPPYDIKLHKNIAEPTSNQEHFVEEAVDLLNLVILLEVVCTVL